MKVLSIEGQSFHHVRYETAIRRDTAIVDLPFLRGQVDYLPAEIDALIITSDLQGREHSDAASISGGRLLGEVVAEELVLLEEIGDIPSLGRTGVLLGGDLYHREEMDRMGGLGDVRSVWRAFARSCAWVVGVPGNHDDFGSTKEERLAFAQGQNWTVLDIALGPKGESVEIGGIRIAGIGGAVGRSDRPNRRTEDDSAAAVRHQLSARPDILITHQHPYVDGARRPGSPGYRDALKRKSGFAVFGHSYCPEPLIEFGANCRALATEGRVFVLVAGR